MPANRRTIVIRVTLENDPHQVDDPEDVGGFNIEPMPHVVKVEVTDPDGTIRDVTQDKTDSGCDAEFWPVTTDEHAIAWGLGVEFAMF